MKNISHSELASESSDSPQKIEKFPQRQSFGECNKFGITNFHGFTLVELIVVVTILIILGTIAFTSLQGYSSFARDSSRISSLSNLQKWLNLFQIKSGTYPMPEGKVDITASGTIIGYQWFAKDQTINIAKLSQWGSADPLDATILTTYSVNFDRTKMQLMSFLEDKNSTIAFISPVFASTASDYSKRSPVVKGDTLGILLASGSLQPLQESGMGVDVVTTQTGYVAYFNKGNSISGSGSVLKRMEIIFTFPNGKIDTSTLSDIINGSLVGYWNMETTASDGRLKDWSGNGNNGLMNGTSSINGKTNLARSFNGMNEYVKVDNSDSLSGDATFSVWLNTNIINSAYHFILARNCNGYPNYQMRIDTLNRFSFGYEVDETHSSFSKLVTTPNINTWYHLVGVRKNNQAYLYVNGVQQTPGLVATGNLSSSQPVYIGAPNVNGNYFSGSIDEVRFYNRALSDSEIQALYNATK